MCWAAVVVAIGLLVLGQVLGIVSWKFLAAKDRRRRKR